MSRFGIGIAAAVSMAVSGAGAAELRLLSSWDKTNVAVLVLPEPFAKGVEAATNGGIKFIISGPETVPPFEQLQPVVSGVFQLLFTHGVYHYGTAGVGVALDAIGGNPESRRQSGLVDAVDRHYQRLGVKLIALPISATRGYHIVLRAPVTPAGDLQGRKLRGTASYHNVFQMLGGAPVVLPVSEVYSALEKGVVDGAASPAAYVLGAKWYEVAKYMLRPGFGVNHYMFLMNLSAWNRLTESERQILLQEGRKLEDVWFKEYDRMVEEEERALIDKGMKVTEMGEAQKAKLNQAWAEGLWSLAEKKSPKDAQEIRELARSKGLTD